MKIITLYWKYQDGCTNMEMEYISNETTQFIYELLTILRLMGHTRLLLEHKQVFRAQWHADSRSKIYKPPMFMPGFDHKDKKKLEKMVNNNGQLKLMIKNAEIQKNIARILDKGNPSQHRCQLKQCNICNKYFNERCIYLMHFSMRVHTSFIIVKILQTMVNFYHKKNCKIEIMIKYEISYKYKHKRSSQ